MNHCGAWKSRLVNADDTFSIVRRVTQQEIFPQQYYKLRQIQYINAVPYDGIPVPVPVIVDPPTRESRRRRNDYRVYRIFLQTQKQIKYKVFKYIYPKAFELNKKINSYDNTITANACPFAVKDYDKQKLRNWRLKQLLMWTQLKDLPVKITEVDKIHDLFPTFKIDFYKVNYIIPRK